MRSSSFGFHSNIPQRINIHNSEKRSLKPTVKKLPEISDSETDVSTSNENLSIEEKYVICNTVRQEPQGQENLTVSVKDNVSSDRSSIDTSSSSYSTLIIHSANEDVWNSSGYSGEESQNQVMPGCYDQKTILRRSTTNSSAISASFMLANNKTKPNSDLNVQEITEIPDDYLSQSRVMKHLAKEALSPQSLTVTNCDLNTRDSGVSENLVFDINHLSETITDPNVHKKRNNWHDKTVSMSASGVQNEIFETGVLSQSQPDLCQVTINEQDSTNHSNVNLKSRLKINAYENNEYIWQSNDMIEILIKENGALKSEIENCYVKIAKTQILEKEIETIQKSYEELVQSSERREKLEKTVRLRLHTDCKKLQDLNKTLKEQIEILSSQLASSKTPIADFSGSESLKKELHKRNVLISQLIAQNKDLLNAKERLEAEFVNQKTSIQEQKNHIGILENTLSDAQSSNIQLEEECRKKQMFVDRMGNLQEILTSLHLKNDYDKLEKPGKKLTFYNDNFYESEINSPDFDEIQKPFHNKDEIITFLQNECNKWEQNYLKSNFSRNEKTTFTNSNSSIQTITDLKSDQYRQIDEAHFTRKQLLQLQIKVQELEGKVAERDALIRALQKYSFEKNLSLKHGSSVLNTSKITLLSSRDEQINSNGFGSISSSCLNNESFNPKNYDETKKSLDDELKVLDTKLDSQLLNKQRGLCCFPKFSNTNSNMKKCKIISTNSNNEKASCFLKSFTNSNLNKNGQQSSNEIIMLEQRGRNSQKQRKTTKEVSEKSNLLDQDDMNDERYRSGSLPPSSLPKPPLKFKQQTSSNRNIFKRHFSDYNRLYDLDNSQLPLPKKSDSTNIVPGKNIQKSMLPSLKKSSDYSRLPELTQKKSHDTHSTSKIRLFSPNNAPSNKKSIDKDKKTLPSYCPSPKYRIQF